MVQSKKKPSETLCELVEFLEVSKEQYEQAKKKCAEYDSMERHVYWAHKFEFADNARERYKLSTAYHNERKERRKAKDIMDKYKAIYDFVNSDNNKGALKRMKGTIEVQKRQEEYLEGERTYKAGEKDDNS